MASKRKNARLIEEFLELRVVPDHPLIWRNAAVFLSHKRVDERMWIVRIQAWPAWGRKRKLSSQWLTQDPEWPTISASIDLHADHPMLLQGEAVSRRQEESIMIVVPADVEVPRIYSAPEFLKSNQRRLLYTNSPRSLPNPLILTRIVKVHSFRRRTGHFVEFQIRNFRHQFHEGPNRAKPLTRLQACCEGFGVWFMVRDRQWRQPVVELELGL